MATFYKTPLYFLYKDENNNSIYIKREDLLPFSFGGNKLRIGIEFIEDMERQGCDYMIAYGGPQSNLCRVISNLCASRNIPCTIVSAFDYKSDPYQYYNFCLSKAFGAEYMFCLKDEVAETVRIALENATKKGFKPYYINGNTKGRGNEHTPVAAYTKVFNEIIEQERDLGLKFNSIFLACGTGMTISGLVCGKIINKTKQDIYGISVSRSSENALPYINKYIEKYLYKHSNSLYDKCVFNENSYKFIDDYALSYGESNDKIDAIIFNFMKNYGIALDSTYTGKAFWGMERYIEENFIKNSNILFIHTGGTPLYFDNLHRILKEG